ncbi:hypothetical protein, partial [Komagataeibacter diospyri]|uniref:hypothetical protein n=1 Tax=Komagataeibacter diospyri TaxID=1932662 RepID=UPI001D053A89
THRFTHQMLFRTGMRKLSQELRICINLITECSKEFTIAQLLRRELKYSKMTSVQIVIAGMGGTDDMPYIILASWRLGLFRTVKT